MVIQVINQFRVDADKTERDTPVAIHPYGPVALEWSFQGMQFVAWLVQLCRRSGSIQGGENAPKFRSMHSLYTSHRTGAIQRLKPLVAEVDDHGQV